MDWSKIFDLLDSEIKTGSYAHMAYKEKFWKQVNIKSENECWEFTNKKYSNGYGCFRINHNDLLAHRISYILSNNELIPDGLLVMHSCDNRSCVNPNHLILGTQSENIRDMVSKKRNNPQREFKSPACILSNEDVSKIRNSSGEKTRKELSELFGVSVVQIGRIINFTRRNYEY